MATGIVAAPVRRTAWPRAKYLLFGFIALMYSYVLWIDESFLFNAKDPEWTHIESFKWWLLPHGLAAGCAPIGIYIQYFEERMGDTRSFTIATVLDAGLWIFATGMAIFFILQARFSCTASG